MENKKIIAVVGATGAQGGGLARAILSDPHSEFAVRALTRDPNSPAAQELAKLGAEVVAADVDNVDSLRKAFEGAYGAFCVTFFWNHFSPEQEFQQASNMAHAAKDAGVEHVVWSTLEDTRKWVPLDSDQMPTLMGKYKVPHFDAKGEADAVFKELGVPTTFFLTSFYWDNFVHFGMGPKVNDDGTLVLNLPMGDQPLAGISADDIGRAAYGVFKAGKSMIGKTVGVAGGHLTGHEMAEKMSAALGRPVTYNAVPFDVYRSLGFPGAEDLGNMFQYYHDFNDDFSSRRSLEGARALNPELKSFDEWLAIHKDQLVPAS